MEDDGKPGNKLNPLQQLINDNAEIRQQLQELIERGISAAVATEGGATQRSFRATSFIRQPVPLPEFDGSIPRGVSYRFDTS